MKVFIIGITGGIGSRLALRLRSHETSVRGLVRGRDQQQALHQSGIETVIGNLSIMTEIQLSEAFGKADAVVFTAGSNGGRREVTKAIDGDGVRKAMGAARLSGIDRFVMVSVLPESWRERDLTEEVQYYFAAKKEADIAVSRSGLDWIVLRPSLLVDSPGRGTVSLGPAEAHGNITRDDVAHTIADLLHEPRIGRQILEVNTGSTPIAEAVSHNIRQP